MRLHNTINELEKKYFHDFSLSAVDLSWYL